MSTGKSTSLTWFQATYGELPARPSIALLSAAKKETLSHVTEIVSLADSPDRVVLAHRALDDSVNRLHELVNLTPTAIEREHPSPGPARVSVMEFVKRVQHQFGNK